MLWTNVLTYDIYGLFCALHPHNPISRREPTTMNESGKITLSEQIYRQLRRDIITQKIPCGAKLTLQTLKEHFGVSHTPIRDALTRLNEEGIITYYSNCGVNVVSFTEQDIRELYQLAAELDSLSVQFCRYSYSSTPLISEMEELLTTSAQLLEQGDIETWQGNSEDFHLLFYHHANNHYLYEAASRIQAKLALLSNLYRSSENIAKIQEEHQAIFNAIRQDDYNLASDLMRKHTQDDVVLALKAYRQFLNT